jgi:hypothetical protein
VTCCRARSSAAFDRGDDPDLPDVGPLRRTRALVSSALFRDAVVGVLDHVAVVPDRLASFPALRFTGPAASSVLTYLSLPRWRTIPADPVNSIAIAAPGAVRSGRPNEELNDRNHGNAVFASASTIPSGLSGDVNTMSAVSETVLATTAECSSRARPSLL